MKYRSHDCLKYTLLPKKCKFLEVVFLCLILRIYSNTLRWLVNTKQLHILVKTSHLGYFLSRMYETGPLCKLSEFESFQVCLNMTWHELGKQLKNMDHRNMKLDPLGRKDGADNVALQGTGKVQTGGENGYIKGGCPFSQITHSKSSPTLGER